MFCLRVPKRIIRRGASKSPAMVLLGNFENKEKPRKPLEGLFFLYMFLIASYLTLRISALSFQL
jgi:hypothetical protein